MSTSATDHSVLADKGKARAGGGAARALGPACAGRRNGARRAWASGSGCETRSGDQGSVALYRHRMRIGLLNHRHDDQGDPLPQAPYGKHFQGRDAPTPAQIPEECQLRLHLRVGHCWRHAEKRHNAAEVAVRFRTERQCEWRPDARGDTSPSNGSPLKKKARSETSHFRAGFAGRSGEGAPPARSETVMKHHGRQRHLEKQTVPIRTNCSPSVARV